MRSHHQPTPSPLALWCLRHLSDPNSRDHLVGDLLEEFEQRQQQDAAMARRWLWRQTFHACGYGIRRRLQGNWTVHLLALFGVLILSPTLVALVYWLSNMDATAEPLWQALLRGDLHVIVLSTAYWQEAAKAFGQGASLGMFINLPALVWSGLVLFTLSVLFRTTTLSARTLLLWGYASAITPYVIGSYYIGVTDMVPTAIGPLLAFMLFAALYLLPCLAIAGVVAQRKGLMAEPS
ncbi:hypothetical protein LJ739_08695 [Aestuariibacter halophilus]|uniref:Uncharacterized protein n=1 Tax=Fluctibacter halophilus TaxID=226011 RepID=A0ABS8G826_9ALTE|nr:hypothetical protein [Aestuariibacter halophilus]MCC2616316.1 hypothetical protein [Aestuariibacter halophilus]